MANIALLKIELDTDPLTRGYAGMDDPTAAATFNVIDREAPPDSGALLQYIILERFRTGNLYGRINMAAFASPLRAGNAWEIPPLPLGAAGADVVPTFDQIQSAAAFMRLLDTDTRFAVSLLDSRIDTILSDLVSVGVIGAGDKTAIQALSENQQSRATELGIGRVDPRHVTQARSIV